MSNDSALDRPADRSWRQRVGAWPRWWVPAVALVLLATFTVVYEQITRGQSVLLRPDNLLNILKNGSFVGIIALGMTFVITLGGIDLSVGSLTAFLGGLGILTINRLLRGNANEGFATFIAALLTLVAGAFAGMLNGLLVTKGRIAPFIATLGGLAAYRSLAMACVDGGEYRPDASRWFHAISDGGIPIPGTNLAPPRAGVVIPLTIATPTIVFFALAVVAWIVLNRTRFGRYVIAVGSNERAAIYSAVRVKLVKTLTYTLLGVCTGLAALLQSSRMNSVSSSQTGVLYELDAIAAVVIGGTRMRGGSGTIAGTVIGVLILGLIGNMLNVLQVSVYLQGLVRGGVIIAAVLLQRAEGDV